MFVHTNLGAFIVVAGVAISLVGVGLRDRNVGMALVGVGLISAIGAVLYKAYATFS